MTNLTEFWADLAQLMKDIYEKEYVNGSRDQFARFLELDGLSLVCFSDKIIDLCKAGDFLAAAQLANSDGWL